ncbi:MAG: amidohydrolase family protein, partial [Litorilinea sp.]
MSTLDFRPRVPVFDANVRVGDCHDLPAPCRDRAGLLAEMDRHGVGRAVVYHAYTEAISPVDGNRYLESWVQDEDRLTPQWSIMPGATSLAQIQALYANGRVQSVRLHNTRDAGLPFRGWAYDELLDWLGTRRIPLWIEMPGQDVDALITTLRNHPALVTVLVGAHYVDHLSIRPLLRHLPNLSLELSRYEPIGEVEALRDEFGAGRLVYGSWYWRYAMGPMLFYLHHTDLTDDELALVCAGNLV